MGLCIGRAKKGGDFLNTKRNMYSFEWEELGVYSIKQWSRQGYLDWNFNPKINYETDSKYRFQPWTTAGRYQRPIITNSDYFELGAFVAMVAGTHGKFILLVEKKDKDSFSWKIVSMSHNLRLDGLDECSLEIEKPLHVIGSRDKTVVLQINRNNGTFEGYVLKEQKSHMKIERKLFFECPEADKCVMEAILSPDCSKLLLKPSWVYYKRLDKDYNNCVYFLDLELEDLITGTIYVNIGHSKVITFDPRYAWSTIAVGTRWAEKAHDNVAVVDLRQRRRLVSSRETEPFSIQNLVYSKDGRYLSALEGNVPSSGHGKIQPSRVKIYASDSLQILKVFSNLGGGFHVPVTPFSIFPLFSEDNRQMAIMYHTSRKNMVSVYNIPFPLDLKSICRAVILKNMSMEELPKDYFPQEIFDFLSYRHKEE